MCTEAKATLQHKKMGNEHQRCGNDPQDLHRKEQVSFSDFVWATQNLSVIFSIS